MRNVLPVFLVLATLALGAPRAGAATIGFSPTPKTVSLNQTFDIDVMIADLAGGLVGDFDVSLGLSSAIVLLTGYTVTDRLGDTSLFEAIDASLGDTGSGIDLAVVSLLPAVDLAALQDGSPFALATLTFKATQVGTTTLSFERSVFGDGSGTPFSPALTTGSITVLDANGAPIPEPASLLLMGSGALGLLARERRRRKRSL